LLGLAAVLVLVLGTGFFVAAEFALVASDRTSVEQSAAAGDRRSKTVLAVLGRLSFHLSGAQLGITVTSLIVGFIAEPTIARLIQPALDPLLDRSAEGVSILLALFIATVLSMVLGELVPKNLAIARPAATARLLAGPLVVVDTVFGPLISVLNGAANRTVRLFGIEPREELQSVRSLPELALLAQASAEEGTLEPEVHDLLSRALRLGEKVAADALVPRVDVEAVTADETAADVVARSGTTGHSRFPVVGEDLDDVRGVVHVKSVLELEPEQRSTTLASAVMGEAFVVPEGRDLESLLVDLRARGTHLAIVIDEYGGTAGIVTLEDVLEEIVGEIDDEHDLPQELSVDLGAGVVELSGSLHPDEVAEATGFEMPEGEYETLAGFVLDRLGRIPAVGEGFEEHGWRLTVTAMDKLRVAGVRLRRPADAEAGDR
jgi:CBS domain containing-hemolysin-like protein